MGWASYFEDNLEKIQHEVDTLPAKPYHNASIQQESYRRIQQIRGLCLMYVHDMRAILATADKDKLDISAELCMALKQTLDLAERNARLERANKRKGRKIDEYEKKLNELAAKLDRTKKEVRANSDTAAKKQLSKRTIKSTRAPSSSGSPKRHLKRRRLFGADRPNRRP